MSLSPQQLWQLSSIYRYEDVEGELVGKTDEIVGVMNARSNKPAVLISRSRLSLSSQLIVAGADNGSRLTLKVRA